ncbi:hypothetical protein CFOL_v3_32522 [Cephalotus follicularis]|uniref:New component of the BRCA1-A complex n=1 Tax=Cephalotus follicularis TaxID=3775 RepID=A0A1Q3D9H9_CEPFO|nr:hypothetical protein CFOL_v3_32522 [Cephalotus follicularis]
MEVVGGETSASASGGGGGGGVYELKAMPMYSEDILFCIDVDAESMVEMKTPGPDGKPLTKLDSIKKSIILFITTKLTINPDHRFAFATLAKTTSWLKKEFSSEVEPAIAALHGLSATTSPCGQADLTQLFRVAAHEAKKSCAQKRLFRVILIYCRSAVIPQHQWPVSQRNFTLDVMYLHEKPGPDNCPQEVYDALVDVLEHVSELEGYIYESAQRLARVLYRDMCVLVSHPQQRCPQDDLDIPKSLTKKAPAAESGNGEDRPPVSNQ